MDQVDQFLNFNSALHYKNRSRFVTLDSSSSSESKMLDKKFNNTVPTFSLKHLNESPEQEEDIDEVRAGVGEEEDEYEGDGDEPESLFQLNFLNDDHTWEKPAQTFENSHPLFNKVFPVATPDETYGFSN